MSDRRQEHRQTLAELRELADAMGAEGRRVEGQLAEWFMALTQEAREQLLARLRVLQPVHLATLNPRTGRELINLARLGAMTLVQRTVQEQLATLEAVWGE